MHPKTESPGLTPPTLTSQMRGRGREVQAVLELLASVAVGRSAILQVDGAPGIGKSRLLTEAQARATDRGFSLATGYAGGLPPSLPLAQLFAGLDVEPPRCVVAGEPSTRSEVEAGLQSLATRVGKLAMRRPILVILDDAQWADEATVLALRALPALLAHQPVGWLLARRKGARNTTTDSLFDEGRQRGAARIELGPLANDAVDDVIADRLQATPDPDLRSLADGAAGNPQLLVALVNGLREDGGIVSSDGRAQLVSGRRPQRVDDVVRDWAEHLSPEARNLLEVAAFMGRSFAVDDLARVYERPSDQLLAPIRECIDCDLLTPVGKNALAFHHDLVRRSVAQRVPAAVRLALSGHPQERTRSVTAAHERRRGVERRPSPGEHASQAWVGLTDTEQAVAEMVARGLTNREVAGRLFLSRHTVSFHLRKVYRKLDVGSRVELARFSIELERTR